jgi:hypothetical protein
MAFLLLSTLLGLQTKGVFMSHSYSRNFITTLLIIFLPLFLYHSALAADIKLAWDPNTEPDLAGYKVYYGTASRAYGPPIDVGNVTTYTLTGLTPGQTYYIAVTAYDTSKNASGYSNEVKWPNQLFVDFNKDGRTDIAVYRSSTGAWYIKPSSGGSSYAVVWGGDPSDIPAPGDYDGDGKTDIAIYRASSGAWFVKPSGGGAIYGVGFGGDASDIPVAGDYDGDGKTDLAIYRKSMGAWFIYPSSIGPSGVYGVGFGGDVTDLPVVTNAAAYM